MIDDPRQAKREQLNLLAAHDLQDAEERNRRSAVTARSGLIPAPNVIAGIAIGLVNDSWLTALGVAAVWPFIFCVYVSFLDTTRRKATVASFAERGHHLLAGSPLLTFYAVEFATALTTAIPFALLAHGVKRLLS